MNRVGLSRGLEALLRLDEPTRRKVIKSLSREARARIAYDWRFWGRADQVWRPSPEKYTLYLAGRGWGKTRVGAEAVQWLAEHPEHVGGRPRRGPDDRDYGIGGVIGIAGRTADDIRETMLHGVSGLITIAPPWCRPVYQPSKRRVVWPNGVVGRLISGDKPQQARGPNLGAVWGDELAHWQRLAETWSNIELSLRHGRDPKAIITTTPLGVRTLVELCYQCDDDGMPIVAANAEGFALNPSSRIVRGSTYDNAANLARSFITEIVAKYEGTRLGEQELHGAILLGIPGALFKRDWFHRCDADDVPELVRIVIAVDVAVSQNPDSAETGIVVAGLGVDDRIYLLRDLSGAHSPNEWASLVVKHYRDDDADAIVCELNQGGNLVEANIRSIKAARRIKVEGLRAFKSKRQRWSLVAGLWEQGRVVHVGPTRHWLKLEHQLTHFDPDKPERAQMLDRGDAATWAAISLLGGKDDRRALRALGRVDAWRRIEGELSRRMRSKKR